MGIYNNAEVQECRKNARVQKWLKQMVFVFFFSFFFYFWMDLISAVLKNLSKNSHKLEQKLDLFC